ncbi:hypothetical protein F4804DRAFT_170724 [Jackrogersella minutella]|nr:hypothetical protein F4804DRAFT_170724 [Jackrogersella minutella]
MSGQEAAVPGRHSFGPENRGEGYPSAAAELLPFHAGHSESDNPPFNSPSQRLRQEMDAQGRVEVSYGEQVDNDTGQSDVAGPEWGLLSHRYSCSATKKISPSIDNNLTSATEQNPNKSDIKANKPFLGWWWWWEIIATLLSIISVILIVVFLIKVKGTALSDWNHVIQPNTVVSILTTVVRSCMMIPIAACLGQYKWWHFRQPRQLQDLQRLDDASRGPWGSLLLLFNVTLWGAPTALCLGVVTILALGIEPSAQQILSFPLRDAQLLNLTANIGKMTDWTLPQYSFMGSFNASRENAFQDSLLEAAILNGALSSPVPTDFDCPSPAARCSWDDFTNLALCLDTAMNTQMVNVTCQHINDTFAIVPTPCSSSELTLRCTYTYPPNSVQDNESPDNNTDSITIVQQECGFGTVHYTLVSLVEESGFYSTKLNVMRSEAIRTGEASNMTDFFFANWTWCARTFHDVTATSRGVDFGSISDENLVAQVDTNEDAPDIFVAQSTGIQYSAAPMAGLLNFLTDGTQALFALQNVVDVRNLTQNVTDTINSLITSNSTLKNPHLENFSGKAYHDEVYINIRWYWIILPVLETLLTSIFLVVLIVINYQQPLLRNSVLAYLGHGLDGWERGELSITPPESVVKLEEVLGNQSARFGRGDDGQLKLRKNEV